MRFRLALALMVAGLLAAAGVATAQTTTDPTGSYTVTTTETNSYTTTTPDDQGTAPDTAGAAQGAAPAAAAATQAAPSHLAFTGAEPLLLIAFGLAGAGVAGTLLVRDRRRATQRR